MTDIEQFVLKTQFCIQVRFSTRRSGPTRGPQKRPVHYKDDNYNNNDKRYSFKNHSKCKQITESTPRNHFQMIKSLTARQNAFSFKEREHLKQFDDRTTARVYNKQHY